MLCELLSIFQNLFYYRNIHNTSVGLFISFLKDVVSNFQTNCLQMNFDQSYLKHWNWYVFCFSFQIEFHNFHHHNWLGPSGLFLFHLCSQLSNATSAFWCILKSHFGNMFVLHSVNMIHRFLSVFPQCITDWKDFKLPSDICIISMIGLGSSFHHSQNPHFSWPNTTLISSFNDSSFATMQQR